VLRALLRCCARAPRRPSRAVLRIWRHVAGRRAMRCNYRESILICLSSLSLSGIKVSHLSSLVIGHWSAAARPGAPGPRPGPGGGARWAPGPLLALAPAALSHSRAQLTQAQARSSGVLIISAPPALRPAAQRRSAPLSRRAAPLEHTGVPAAASAAPQHRARTLDSYLYTYTYSEVTPHSLCVTALRASTLQLQLSAHRAAPPARHQPPMLNLIVNQQERAHSVSARSRCCLSLKISSQPKKKARRGARAARVKLE
jgi:hypothetical protein